MKREKGKTDRMAGPISGRPPSGFPSVPISREGRGGKWAMVALGALVLSLVAFFSGVRMGKALTGLRQGEETASRVKEEAKPVPFFSEVKKESLLPRREPQRLLPGVQENKQVKEEPVTVSPPKKEPEKNSRPAEKVAAPVPEKEKKEPPPAPKNKYALQVAAFNNSEEARDLVNQLKRKGYPAYQISGSAAAKGTLHRVRIGQFPSLQEAKQFALIFEKKEKMKTIITGP